MHQVRDWLFIGGAADAVETPMLRHRKIKAVLALHQKRPSDGIETLFLPVQEGVPLSPAAIQQGVGFIQAQHGKERSVLVACGMGVSRSVTFATAALDVIEGLRLHEAFLSIHAHHSEALPDHLHWESVRALYGEDWDYWTLWRHIMGEED